MKCKAIRGVLPNFLDTYTSRYSDFYGYWIFGLITDHLNHFSVDLIDSNWAAVEPLPLREAVRLAVVKFREQLEKSGLSLSCIQEARLEAHTCSDYPAGKTKGRRPDELDVEFTVTVTIQNGRRYETRTSKFIQPRNLKRILRYPEVMIGLPKGIVYLVPYSDQWPRLFAEEATRLNDAIGQHTLAIEHIGSTAVPGLAAKPVIDIAIAVRRIEDVAHCVAPLERLGYEYRGENGIPGRHFFGKGEPRTHHLHIVEKTSDHWPVHLSFRDYLRQHDETRDEYQALKEELAQKYRYDRLAYTDAKAEFIQGVLRLAGGAIENRNEGV